MNIIDDKRGDPCEARIARENQRREYERTTSSNEVRTVPRFTASASAHYAAARAHLETSGRLIEKADAAEKAGNLEACRIYQEEAATLHRIAREEMAAAEVAR